MQDCRKKRRHSSKEGEEASHKRLKWDHIRKEDMLSTIKLQDLSSCLLLHIFSFLGFRDVFRMRAVCKLWNSLLGSREFAGMWKTQENSLVFAQETYRASAIEPFSYWRFLHSEDGLSPSDDEEEFGMMEQRPQVWHPQSGVVIGGPGVPPSHPPFCPCMKEGNLYARMRYKPDPCFTILASGEGLVCGHLKKEPGFALAVGNPLTRAWKRLPPVVGLPPLPDYCQLCALMLVDTVVCPSCSYKIVICPQFRGFGSRLDPFWLIIYDSKVGRWERAPKLEDTSLLCHFGIPVRFPHQPFTRYDSRLDVAAFDVATRSWSAVIEAHPPPELTAPRHILGFRLFPYKGECILIAAGSRDNFFCAAWVLEEQRKAFKLLSKMSERMEGPWEDYALQVELYPSPFSFVTDGHLVVVTAEVADLQVWPVVAYNLELRTWTMMRVPRPQFAYDRLCILSPSLLAERVKLVHSPMYSVRQRRVQ